MIDDFAEAITTLLTAVGDVLADEYPELLITFFLVILAVTVK
ncbi:MAG: hypothetical protein ABI690_13545 [Chloroflexota bacterium]